MENSNRTILVTGATGNQGGSIARHLLQRGKFKVLAMVRDENKPAAKALKQLGAELIKADFNDRASLDRAIQGVYGVFSIQDFREGADVEIQHGNATRRCRQSGWCPAFCLQFGGKCRAQHGHSAF